MAGAQEEEGYLEVRPKWQTGVRKNAALSHLDVVMQGMQKHEQFFKERTDTIRSMFWIDKLALKRAEDGAGKPAWGLLS